MKRGIAALLAGCGLLLAAGCGSSSKSSSSSNGASTSSAASSGIKANTTPKYGTPATSAGVQSGTVKIAYRNIAINPDTVKVKVGSTLEWTNYDSVVHNVTSENGPQKFVSKSIAESGTYHVKVTKPGTIHYLCTFHPASMNGTIEVVS